MYCSDNKAGIHLTPLFDAVACRLYQSLNHSVFIFYKAFKPVDYEVNSVQVCRGGEREKDWKREETWDRQKKRLTEERQKDKVRERESIEPLLYIL